MNSFDRIVRKLSERGVEVVVDGDDTSGTISVSPIEGASVRKQYGPQCTKQTALHDGLFELKPDKARG